MFVIDRCFLKKTVESEQAAFIEQCTILEYVLVHYVFIPNETVKLVKYGYVLLFLDFIDDTIVSTAQKNFGPTYNFIGFPGFTVKSHCPLLLSVSVTDVIDRNMLKLFLS